MQLLLLLHVYAERLLMHIYPRAGNLTIQQNTTDTYIPLEPTVWLLKLSV